MERLQLMLDDYIINSKLSIIVKPNSSKTEIIGFDKDKKTVKIAIKAAPEKGKANLELIKFISKLSKKKTRIVSGLKSHSKTLELS